MTENAPKGTKANLPPKTVHHSPVMVGDYKIVSAEFVKGSTSIKHLPEERLPQIAFLGRSNVGKSSLMNALMGRKDLVKVGRTPGKTRELNFFKVNGKFFLVDLPGVGFAKVSNSKYRDGRSHSGYRLPRTDCCQQTRQGQPVGTCQRTPQHQGKIRARPESPERKFFKEIRAGGIVAQHFGSDRTKR